MFAKINAVAKKSVANAPADACFSPTRGVAELVLNGICRAPIDLSLSIRGRAADTVQNEFRHSPGRGEAGVSRSVSHTLLCHCIYFCEHVYHSGNSPYLQRRFSGERPDSGIYRFRPRSGSGSWFPLLWTTF